MWRRPRPPATVRFYTFFDAPTVSPLPSYPRFQLISHNKKYVYMYFEALMCERAGGRRRHVRQHRCPSLRCETEQHQTPQLLLPIKHAALHNRLVSSSLLVLAPRTKFSTRPARRKVEFPIKNLRETKGKLPCRRPQFVQPIIILIKKRVFMAATGIDKRERKKSNQKGGGCSFP